MSTTGEQKFTSEIINKDMNIISCPKQISEIGELLALEIKSWLLQPVSLHVLDLAGVKSVDKECRRQFTVFNQTLKRNSKFLSSVNVSSELKIDLASDGLNDVFSSVDNLDQARKLAGLVLLNEPKQQKLDPRFLKPFISAVEKVFSVQFSTELEKFPAVPKVKFSEGCDIAGILNISTDQFVGSISICFSKETFINFYEIMLDERPEKLTDEVQDAASEILNMVYGQAKTTLNAEGFQLGLVIPTVLSGENMKIANRENDVAVVIPFKSVAGSFFLEISLNK